MFSLKQVTPTAGDCSAGYSVTLDNEYSVKEFIDEVLKTKRREWGHFEITNINVVTEYRYGRILKQNIPEEIMQSKIISVSALGGWTRMDYRIEVEILLPEEDDPESCSISKKDLFDDPKDYEL